MDNSRRVIYAGGNAEDLGIITWNTEHFSDHDILLLIGELQAQLHMFNVGVWNYFFRDFNEMVADIRKDPDIQKYLKNPLSFGKKLRKGDAFSVKFKGLHSPIAKIQAICALLKKYAEIQSIFDTQEFASQIKAHAEVDWRKMYETSQPERARRVLLRRGIVALKTFIEDIDRAKQFLSVVQKFKQFETFIKRLKDIQALHVSGIFATLTTIHEQMPTVTTPDTLRRALHSQNIVVHINEMFLKNRDWLDILVLQEINNPALLDSNPNAPYVVYRGPHLISTDGEGQHEYYPLLVRKNAGIELKQVYIIKTDGSKQNVVHDERVPWNKHNILNRTYRPIVVYEIAKHGPTVIQTYLIGVIHTTPLQKHSDDILAEYSRHDIYATVHPGLARLKQLASEQGVPLIVGGDYYLSAEAVVKDIDGQGIEYIQSNRRLLEDFLKVKSAVVTLKENVEKEVPVTIAENQKALLRERLKFLEEASSDKQILRNVLRLTVAAQIEDLGLFLAQALSGTNPKTKSLGRWFDLQIADFYVYNQAFTGCVVGIIRPEGKIVLVDSEDLHYSRYWQHFSDHFPVGAIFSLQKKNSDLLSHPAVAGSYSAKAYELARVSNTRRFARLKLITQKQAPDLTLRSEEEVQHLALQYLHNYLSDILGGLSFLGTLHTDAGNRIQQYIASIQQAEMAFRRPKHLHLFVTEAGDFEGASDTQGTPPVSKNSGKPLKKPLFLLQQRQELQDGWNCGDIALGISRQELVMWLLHNKGVMKVRQLLAPEIRLAAAQSYATHVVEESDVLQQSRLQELFRLFDEAREEEVCSLLIGNIHVLLSDIDDSLEAANRHGLPETMLTDEIRLLLKNYYDAHENMREVVSQINDALNLQGEARKDAMQLARHFVLAPEEMLQVPPLLLQPYQHLLSILQQHDANLQGYCTREDVFTSYVNLYYNQKGWMVYHLDFADQMNESTSIIDAVAMYKQTQVCIWTYSSESNLFLEERRTEQYGTGVIHILYNGYNHFIGLQPNPELSGFVNL